MHQILMMSWLGGCLLKFLRLCLAWIVFSFVYLVQLYTVLVFFNQNQFLVPMISMQVFSENQNHEVLFAVYLSWQVFFFPNEAILYMLSILGMLFISRMVSSLVRHLWIVYSTHLTYKLSIILVGYWCICWDHISAMRFLISEYSVWLTYLLA